MATASPYPMARERDLILASLLVLATAAWVVLISQALPAAEGMAGLTMGMEAPLFLAVWVGMMVAMMFPTAAPMILVFARTMDFPWPHLRDAIYFSGLVGLIFALLQVWVLIKLLREWWGEPDECVAWWPPLALCMQLSLLMAATGRILAG